MTLERRRPGASAYAAVQNETASRRFAAVNARIRRRATGRLDATTQQLSWLDWLATTSGAADDPMLSKAVARSFGAADQAHNDFCVQRRGPLLLLRRPPRLQSKGP